MIFIEIPLKIHWFSLIFIDFEQTFGQYPLIFDSNFYKFSEITNFLREHNSMMASSLRTLRHVIAIYSPRSLRFRAQNATAIAGRDPKSRQQLRLKSVWALPAMCTGLALWQMGQERYVRSRRYCDSGRCGGLVSGSRNVRWEQERERRSYMYPRGT